MKPKADVWSAETSRHELDAREAIKQSKEPSSPDPFTVEAARALTDEVKADAAALWAKLLRLYEGGAHTALGYASWREYCAEEFNLGKSRSYQVLDAARVVEALPESTNVERPRSEAVARELVPVLRDEPAEVKEVWADVTYLHGPEPTAKQVREKVQARRGPTRMDLMRMSQSPPQAPAIPTDAASLAEAFSSGTVITTHAPKGPCRAHKILAEADLDPATPEAWQLLIDRGYTFSEPPKGPTLTEIEPNPLEAQLEKATETEQHLTKRLREAQQGLEELREPPAQRWQCEREAGQAAQELANQMTEPIKVGNIVDALEEVTERLAALRPISAEAIRSIDPALAAACHEFEIAKMSADLSSPSE
jgi:hypothetical protein